MSKITQALWLVLVGMGMATCVVVCAQPSNPNVIYLTVSPAGNPCGTYASIIWVYEGEFILA